MGTLWISYLSCRIFLSAGFLREPVCNSSVCHGLCTTGRWPDQGETNKKDTYRARFKPVGKVILHRCLQNLPSMLSAVMGCLGKAGSSKESLHLQCHLYFSNKQVKACYMVRLMFCSLYILYMKALFLLKVAGNYPVLPPCLWRGGVICHPSHTKAQPPAATGKTAWTSQTKCRVASHDLDQSDVHLKLWINNRQLFRFNVVAHQLPTLFPHHQGIKHFSGGSQSSLQVRAVLAVSVTTYVTAYDWGPKRRGYISAG